MAASRSTGEAPSAVEFANIRLTAAFPALCCRATTCSTRGAALGTAGSALRACPFSPTCSRRCSTLLISGSLCLFRRQIQGRPFRPAVAPKVRGQTGAGQPQIASQRVGITALELAEVTTRPGIEPINPDTLETWLVDAGLAELDGDRPPPTAKTPQVAGALDPEPVTQA
jgi:hypothetical protein